MEGKEGGRKRRKEEKGREARGRRWGKEGGRECVWRKNKEKKDSKGQAKRKADRKERHLGYSSIDQLKCN